MTLLDNAQQLDFGGLLFDRKRTVLYPDEIAERLNCTKQHVLNLIESGSLGAVNIGNGEAKFWRVPVGEWEKFLKARSSV